MTALPQSSTRVASWDWRGSVPMILATAAGIVLFALPATTLVRDWWNDSEAGHGLLLAPLALWLAWRRGLSPARAPNILLGTAMLLAAVLLRYVGGLAAELFTLRFSMMLGLLGATVFAWGIPQLRRWWLSFALLLLSIPLPVLVTNALALPLQFKASSMGAALLAWRDVPVKLSGNVILLPGRQLFVTEACSGLRSLAALISLGVLVGGLWLRTPLARVIVLAFTIPVAILVNAIRVFLTGFLVYFVNPKMGEGFLHLTEGWLLFVVAFGILGSLAWAASKVEQRLRDEPANA